MKTLIAATLFALACLPVSAAEKTPINVSVFTAANPSGLVDAASKARDQAVNTIAQQLQKPPSVSPFGDQKKAAARLESARERYAPVSLVDRGTASVTIEVVGGAVEPTTRGQIVSVEAELRRGDYVTHFRQVAGDARIAAVQMAFDLRKWLDDNYAMVAKP